VELEVTKWSLKWKRRLYMERRESVNTFLKY
jgi:hypothetical protein